MWLRQRGTQGLLPATLRRPNRTAWQVRRRCRDHRRLTPGLGPARMAGETWNGTISGEFDVLVILKFEIWENFKNWTSWKKLTSLTKKPRVCQSILMALFMMLQYYFNSLDRNYPAFKRTLSKYLPYIGVDEITDEKKGGKLCLFKECSAHNPILNIDNYQLVLY